MSLRPSRTRSLGSSSPGPARAGRRTERPSARAFGPSSCPTARAPRRAVRRQVGEAEEEYHGHEPSARGPGQAQPATSIPCATRSITSRGRRGLHPRHLLFDEYRPQLPTRACTSRRSRASHDPLERGTRSSRWRTTTLQRARSSIEVQAEAPGSWPPSARRRGRHSAGRASRDWAVDTERPA